MALITGWNWGVQTLPSLIEPAGEDVVLGLPG